MKWYTTDVHNTDTVRHFCGVVGCHAGLSQIFPLPSRQNKVFYQGRTQGPLENRRGLGEFLLLIVCKFFFSFAMSACFFFSFSLSSCIFFPLRRLHALFYAWIICSHCICLPPLPFTFLMSINVKLDLACAPRHNNHFLKKHGRLKSTPSLRFR